MYLQSLELLWPMVKEMHYQEKTKFELDPKVKGVNATWNVAQFPRHHVTFASAKFDVAASHGLGEDAFIRKYIIWPLSWGQGHTKCCPVPLTVCAPAKFDIATSHG